MSYIPAPGPTALARPRARILQAGRNCWAAGLPVRASGLLVDANDYYRAFWQAASQARHYLLIAGWRFNSDVRLLRGADAEKRGGDLFFLPFLDSLCERNPQLRIHVLAWDFSAIFAHEWELDQAELFESGKHGRLHFRYDDELPTGGCHHQKFVVVDGHLAFLGGLDFCSDDWDDRAHRAHNPLRADSGKPAHHPYHDVQAVLTGPAVLELRSYFELRWQRATGERLDLPNVGDNAALEAQPSVALAGREVAFSRNEPATAAHGEPVQEIRQLYRDAIHAAETLIYMENQYFSSQAVFDAVRERMQAADRPGLDIVLILPKQLPSWLETVAMGPPRLALLDALRDAAKQTGHRLGLYYTVAKDGEPQEVPNLIHSKVLVVDDRFLTVGSANASNRSMGLDTELNVSWEGAGVRDRALIRSIRATRVNLLAEHCGLMDQPHAQRPLARTRGLVAHLDELALARSHRLRALTRETILEDREWVGTLERAGFSLDPKGPILDEARFESLGRPSGPGWGRAVRWFRDRVLGRLMAR
jgi:phosphatidylserine/phosphatidylglycerophosphate/cardiolipin synthase-like enzyme